MVAELLNWHYDAKTSHSRFAIMYKVMGLRMVLLVLRFLLASGTALLLVCFGGCHEFCLPT